MQIGPPLQDVGETQPPRSQVSPPGQRFVQLPQWVAEVSVLTQTVPQHVSLFAQPVVWQLAPGWHAPPTHASPAAQARPHPPQSLGLVASSTQTGPQHDRPVPHAPPGPHTGMHSRFWQISPGGQSDELRHPTQVRVGMSQNGFVRGHIESLVQPPGGKPWHWWVVGSQASPFGHVSGIVKHATHTPGGSSQ